MKQIQWIFIIGIALYCALLLFVFQASKFDRAKTMVKVRSKLADEEFEKMNRSTFTKTYEKITQGNKHFHYFFL